jgi:integrase
MPKLSPHALPAYRRHKQSGQAVVTLNGKDVLLGTFGTAASKEAYARVTGEWHAAGRQLSAQPAPLTVVELLAAFLRHAKNYYRHPDGSQTGEADNYRLAMVPLRHTHGRSAAAAFGPLALKAVRDDMVRRGWTRGSVNRQASRVRAIFKWAAENELVPGTVHQSLATVAGLRRGRSAAAEADPVGPVADRLVDGTLPRVSPQVAAMIRLQRLTGMRPGEVCSMRVENLDRADGAWSYRPAGHKTAHHGHDRFVPLGPQAVALLAPLLADKAADDHVFDPRDAEASRRMRARALRRTPPSCGNRAGTNRVERPARAAGKCYDVAAYRRAIARGCDQAFPPPGDLARRRVAGAKGTRWETAEEWKERLGGRWREVEAWLGRHRWHPHQLRHTAGTAIRREFGVEAAQVILGHRTLKVTELYAEKNVEEARRIMAIVG